MKRRSKSRAAYKLAANAWAEVSKTRLYLPLLGYTVARLIKTTNQSDAPRSIVTLVEIAELR